VLGLMLIINIDSMTSALRLRARPGLGIIGRKSKGYVEESKQEAFLAIA